jgi:cupin 2 domain-containing protein
MRAIGNLLRDLAPKGSEEEITQLLRAPAVRIERIVSHGHASAPGFWYDQDRAEWVLLLQGAAILTFEREAEPIRLGRAIMSTSRRTRVIASSGPIRTTRRSGSPCIIVTART